MEQRWLQGVSTKVLLVLRCEWGGSQHILRDPSACGTNEHQGLNAWSFFKKEEKGPFFTPPWPPASCPGPSASWQAQTQCPATLRRCAPRPGRGPGDARRKDGVGGETWEDRGFQRRVSRDGGKNVCWLSSREEQHFPRAVVWAGGTKLRAREFPLFLPGASHKWPLWGLITAWLRVSLPFWGVQGHCPRSKCDTSQADILCHFWGAEQLPIDL